MVFEDASDLLPQGAGALAMDDGDVFQMGQIGIVQVLIDHRSGLIEGHAPEVDLRGYGRYYARWR